MKIVTQYLEKNKTKIAELFSLRAKEGEIQATNLHAFLQEIFKIESIKFTREGKDYFREDENQSRTEKIIEQYYKTTAEGKKAKFYLYRVTFNAEEVEDYLEYWIATDKSIKVEVPPPPTPVLPPVEPVKE